VRGRRNGQSRPKRARVIRDLTLPGPSPEQVDAAVKLAKEHRQAAGWDASSFGPFHAWCARLEDPFLQECLSSFPQPDSTTNVIETSDEHADTMRALARDAVPRFETAQAVALERLIRVVEGVDPAPLLCGMLFLVRSQSWGTYFEPHSEPRTLDLELVAAIITGLPVAERRPTTADDLRIVASAAQELRWRVRALALAHRHAQEESIEADARQELLGRWLTLRGAAYAPHAKAVAQELAAQVPSMRARLGFAVDDLLDLAETLERQWEQRLSPALSECWDATQAATGETPDNPWSGSEQFADAFMNAVMRALPHVVCTDMDGQAHLLDEARAPRESTILHALGMRPGDGNPVDSVPTDPPQRTRPFLLLPAPLDGSWPPGAQVALLANPAALNTDVHLTVEALLAARAPNWPAARARAVDGHALQLLRQALPGARVVSNVLIDGPSGREEVDGIVVYEDVVIVVEGKGAPLKLAARRGSVDKLTAQLTELIGKGYRQLQRDRDYVLGGRPARFYDKSGACVLALDGSAVRRCYQLMPTVDGLGDAGVSLPRLTDLGILPAAADPWIVGLTQLHVVVEMLTRPAEFVGYMEFRSRWAPERRLRPVDEYDMLTLFLRQVDLPGDLAQVPEHGHVIYAPDQTLFDQWYAGQSGAAPIGPKPRVETTKRFRRFVEERGRLKPEGWLASVSAALQIPYADAVDLDALEAELAAEARSEGVSVRGNHDSILVAVANEEPWEPVFDELVGRGTLMRTRSVCLLRQRGGRLVLEDVRFTDGQGSFETLGRARLA
jgi:hypothetical protein